MLRWSRPFHPLDFSVIDFMQVNDYEGRRREGTTWTVNSKGWTRGDWGGAGRGEVDYRGGADDQGDGADDGGGRGGGADDGGFG